jgi:hypothetical protein
MKQAGLAGRSCTLSATSSASEAGTRGSLGSSATASLILGSAALGGLKDGLLALSLLGVVQVVVQRVADREHAVGQVVDTVRKLVGTARQIQGLVTQRDLHAVETIGCDSGARLA